MDGDVYFRVRSLDSYGSLSRRDVDQMDQGEGVEGSDRKQDPLDFALWKATKEGEDTAWDSPWGRGRPGWHIECSAMAEELLGLEFDIHGGGIDLVFPHHENEAAQTLAGRGKPLAKLWMHNGMLQLASEKMSKSVGNIRGLGEVLDQVGGEALVLYFSGGHYRQPIAFSDERLEEAVRSAARIREAGRRLGPGESPAELAAAARRVLRRAGRRLQHRAGAGRALRLDPRGEQARGRGGRRRTCARCSTCSGLASLLEGEDGPPRRGASRWPSSAPRRARRATGPRPTASATSCAPWAGRFAMARKDRSSSRRPEGRGAEGAAAEAARRAARRAPRPGGAAGRGAAADRANVYGRNAVREALRGRRRVRHVWATAAAAKEVPEVRTVVGADEITARCGSDAHQGVCAEAEPYPYADAAELLAVPDPFLVALDEVTDPQNLGAVIRTAECAGATGVIIPERRSGGGDRRGREGVGGSGRAPARGARPQPRGLPRATPRRPAAGRTARRPAPARRIAPPTTPEGWFWCWGRREGAAPAGRVDVRRAGGPADPRTHRFAQRQRRRSGPDVRDLAETA